MWQAFKLTETALRRSNRSVGIRRFTNFLPVAQVIQPFPRIRHSHTSLTDHTMTISWEEYRQARLYDAAARGQASSVEQMLTDGVDPDWCNPEDGLTPLHIAALKGRSECVFSLLHAGADIYATGSHGCTALDLFLEQKTLFKVCDRMFTSRNYKDCFAFLRKAHADCEDRVKGMDEYQGVVIINPGEELDLVHDDVPEVVRREMMRRSSSIADSRRTSEEEPRDLEARCLVKTEVLRLSGSELEQPLRVLDIEA